MTGGEDSRAETPLHLPTSTPRQPVATLLTGSGRGAVATIAVAGSGARELVNCHFRATTGKLLSEYPGGRIVYGQWPLGPESQEQLVVCPWSDRYVEIHCHGGQVVASSILEQLTASGCQRLDWASWLDQTEPDSLRRAAERALPLARTERTAAILLDQYRGALRRELLTIIDEIQNTRLAAADERLTKLASRHIVGVHLTRPWRVVLAGQPNVGKSSLINRCLGFERSIVYDQPGTTRDVVTGWTAVQGWPVELSDTAGLRQGEDVLEAAGVERALRQLAQADCVVLVFDASRSWSPLDQQLLNEVPHALVVHNKSDLAISRQGRPSGIWTSAETGEGLAGLLGQLVAPLEAQAPEPGQAVPFTEEQIAVVRRATEHLRADQAEQAVTELATLL